MPKSVTPTGAPVVPTGTLGLEPAMVNHVPSGMDETVRRNVRISTDYYGSSWIEGFGRYQCRKKTPLHI